MIWKLRKRVRKAAPKAVRKWFLQRVSPLVFYQVSVQGGLFPFRVNTKQRLSFSFVIMGWSKMRTAYFQGCWADSCHQLSPPSWKDRTIMWKGPSLACIWETEGFPLSAELTARAGARVCKQLQWAGYVLVVSFCWSLRQGQTHSWFPEEHSLPPV